MRYSHSVAIMLLMCLSGFCPAPAHAQNAKPDLGANAAMKYWQAFALLPTLDEDQEKLLQNWNKVPLDATALSLIGRSGRSRTYLYRGAKQPSCDWSLDYEDGIGLVLPHLTKSMTLARLAALHARHEFEQGHAKEGLEDVIAILKLAGHAKGDQLIIPHLVGCKIETTAIEAAVPYLAELKLSVPETQLAALDGITEATLQQMVLKEKLIGGTWLIQELKQVEQRKPGAWQDVWKGVIAGESLNQDLVEPVKTLDEAIALLEGMFPLYDELAKLMDLPWQQFDAQYPAFAKKAKAANRLADLILPSMDRVVAVKRRNQAQLAMFKAALAVVQGGPDKLTDSKDPFGDGPFEYRALDKGFELKSKLQFEGQPVTLTIGKVKKE